MTYAIARLTMRASIVAIVFALLSSPNVAHAEEECAGWFCNETSKLNGEPVTVELQDGTTVKGVIVEIAADHVTLAVGDTKVTLLWTQIVTFKVVAPATTPKAAEPEPPVEEEEEVVAEEPRPAAKPASVAVVSPLPPEPPEPPPPPREHLGPFSVGARLKLLAAFGGTRFHERSVAISDFAPAGIGFDLSLAIRLNRILFLKSTYEHIEFSHGDANPGLSYSPSSDAVGIGLRALYGNAPDVRGVFEIGVGYRWMYVPYGNGRAPDSVSRSGGSGWATFEGAESVRMALGTSAAMDGHGRFELLLEGALGRFSRVTDDNLEKRSYRIQDSAQSHHVFVGVSLGMELGG